MSQSFKTIYFSDFPAESSNKKNLTLAFSNKDAEVYETFKTLSSQELREVLGHPTFGSLQQAADKEGIAVNTYCLRLLRMATVAGYPRIQPKPPNLTARPLPLFEPIQTTFRGGQTEPLHDWFPYLEGYSPQFVEQVIHEFAPNAASILDPFAGGGTTPLTVAGLGRQAYYCELNPLLQYLIEVKTIALTAEHKARLKWSAHLRTLAQQINKSIEDTMPDEQLKVAYTSTFGSSSFFDSQTFNQVLCMRAFIDELACAEPFVARFLMVAVLSSLIPSSLLIRRGDVRFRIKSEETRRSNFMLAVKSQLLLMANDLERISLISKHPELICENARYLESLPLLDIDTVLTSPPYLNGTNYFRNTKVELWFLRCLGKAPDLSAFRHRAITAGINDVTVGKTITDDLPQSIRNVVKRLEECAYDMRIPLMVASYFAEMNLVFNGLKRHFTKSGTLLIDIGDSSYAGVHVPTHSLLSELLTVHGFTFEREVVLRRRMSRSGEPLQQFLLVFRAPKLRNTRETLPSLDREIARNWMRFKKNLPHQQGDYAKRNWGHPLHSLCSYQGKMKPALAAHLVKTFVPRGGRFLDIFSGTGTIPFEAALHGARSWGFEISPAAFHISNAKLGRHDAEECERLIKTLELTLQTDDVTEDELKAAKEIRFNGVLPDYFAPETFREILIARRYFLQNPPQTSSESLVFASLLHILHGNRPYALSRRSHPITPFAPTGLTEYRSLIRSLREKVNRSLGVEYPKEFLAGETLLQDATSWWPQEVNELDAIITSPPFFDSTRFYLANWMRLWFCGWEWLSFRTQPLAYVDERQKTSFEIYNSIFRQARERLKAGGVFVLHLGESRKCNMAEALRQKASRWFRVLDVFSESVAHCESHGIRDKGTVTSHQYLVLG